MIDKTNMLTGIKKCGEIASFKVKRGKGIRDTFGVRLVSSLNTCRFLYLSNRTPILLDGDHEPQSFGLVKFQPRRRPDNQAKGEQSTSGDSPTTLNRFWLTPEHAENVCAIAVRHCRWVKLAKGSLKRSETTDRRQHLLSVLLSGVHYARSLTPIARHLQEQSVNQSTSFSTLQTNSPTEKAGVN